MEISSDLQWKSEKIDWKCYLKLRKEAMKCRKIGEMGENTKTENRWKFKQTAE